MSLNRGYVFNNLLDYSLGYLHTYIISLFEYVAYNCKLQLLYYDLKLMDVFAAVSYENGSYYTQLYTLKENTLVRTDWLIYLLT